MTNRVTLEHLRSYFKKHVGPVFCQPSRNLLHRYARMTEMMGIIHPLGDGQLIQVDWTLDPKWGEAVTLYPALKDMSFSIDELHVIRPGSDVPQIADLRYEHNWTPSKLGSVVCISHPRFSDSFSVDQPSMVGYTEFLNQVGVVVEKCLNTDDSVMVTFTGEHDSIVVNVPTELLMHLPDSFRPSHNKKEAAPVQTISSKAPKFKEGDILRVGSSVVDESYMGLLCRVISSEETVSSAFSHLMTHEYTLDFDLLPNRNLALGEPNLWRKIRTACIQLKEKDLDTWNEKESDKAHFGMFRAYANRADVWVPHRLAVGRVNTQANLDKSESEGMSIVVTIDEESRHHLSCRDVDYVYDPDVLLENLAQSFVMLGVEKDAKNPNVPAESHVYLYAFNRTQDIGDELELRILLGTLLTTPSKQKKFARALLGNKLTHPWDVRRYLKLKSLGHLYHILDAPSYLERVGNFCVQ